MVTVPKFDWASALPIKNRKSFLTLTLGTDRNLYSSRFHKLPVNEGESFSLIAFQQLPKPKSRPFNEAAAPNQTFRPKAALALTGTGETI